ncbi:MAG: di-heme enzyme [Gemmatimonadetes bacterium]|nr:di-heme enzyme [Gemmatimonadota bacterium]
MSDAKVALGRRLFYDPRLSANGAFSCSSCHHQAKAFADGRNRPFGVTGQLHPRNSMALANVAYEARYGWADPNTASLEAQARIPLFGEAPIELGLRGKEDTLLARLRAVPIYAALFRSAFARDTQPVTIDNAVRALAAFERTLISVNSPYDLDARRTGAPLPPAAKRGAALFFSDRLKCARCHSGPFFTNAARATGAAEGAPEFFNTGLYNVGGTGAYPEPNTGLYAVTGVATDMGRFKVPSLRNVAVSYPYMHDGSVATLDDAIDHYAAGGRTVTLGPGTGVGRANPYKSPLVAGFAITPAERSDLVAFLRALTDSTFLTDARFSNPWIVR